MTTATAEKPKTAKNNNGKADETAFVTTTKKYGDEVEILKASFVSVIEKAEKLKSNFKKEDGEWHRCHKVSQKAVDGLNLVNSI